MKNLNLILLFLYIGLAQNVTAQEEKMDEAAMIAQWMEVISPGEQHAWLKSHTGDFTAVNESWMMPGAPSTKSEGTSSNVMLMGDRYLLSQYHGEAMGMPFEGQGMLAYDNITKEYINTWIDNMGTGIMVFKGSRDGNKLSMTSEFKNPMTGKTELHRILLDYLSIDHHNMNYFVTEPGSAERKIMQIVYKRKS